MATHPDIVRVHRRVRRQKWALIIGLAGLILAGLGGGLLALSTPSGSSWMTAAGGATLLAASLITILALLAYIVLGLFVRSAVKALGEESVLAAPVEPGERFGAMRVLVSEPDQLCLALGVSPLVAGLGRLLGCLLLVIGSGLCVWGLFAAPSHPLKLGVFAAVLLFTAATLAWMPYAMQWSVGPLPESAFDASAETGAPGDGQDDPAQQADSGLGIEIERVRWFFRRDVVAVPIHRIASLYMSGTYLTLRIKDGSSVALVRTRGSNILDRWNKKRLVKTMEAVLGETLEVEEAE